MAAVVTTINCGSDWWEAGIYDAATMGWMLLMTVCRCKLGGLNSEADTNCVRSRSVRASPEGRH